MRNVYEVLQEKQSAIRRVAREIEILRLAAPLLTEDVPAGLSNQDAHAHEVQNHNLQDHDLQDHDLRDHDLQNHDLQNHDLRNHDAQTEALPSDNARMHGISGVDGNTGAVSVPLADGPDDAESEGEDEASSAPGQKISARLKRFAKPLVSLVAG